MFCSQCGAKAAGKFCSSCGAPLLAIVPGPNADDHDPQPPIDWKDLVDYETLLRVPEVRDRIAKSGAQSKKRMTGEEFLDMYGAALGKTENLGVIEAIFYRERGRPIAQFREQDAQGRSEGAPAQIGRAHV